MTPEEIKAKEAEAAAKEKAEKEAKDKAPLQDPIKQELDKEKEKKAFTDKEKATFNLRRQAGKAKELGIDPKEILGVEEKSAEEVPDWYKREQAKSAQETALQMADGISDADVRDLVKQYLNSRIIPSGDPQADFRLAFSAVSALKNKQILEDVNRRTSARVTSSGGSQSAAVADAFTPTETEAVFMAPPYNISKEKIIEARKKVQARQS